ncbi:MAG: bifunctional homocysteine S-methyltransferase/methylenetetrahydrofolate reductase [Oscillibacter sp.]|nr:bifunctional homocysteine S-methyltransferase/methylenetetrahydrofolate reductase [Oscillibacter sp.]
MKDIRLRLKDGPLLFDGGMASCFAEKFPGERCEPASLTRPEEIAAIHRAYLNAGAQALKTNTYGLGADFAGDREEDAKDIIQAACRLALDAAGDRAYVFADIGPAPEDRALSRGENYIRQADCFLAQGLRHFLLETLPSHEGVGELARYVKEKAPDSFLIVSFAVSSDGVTCEGRSGRELFRWAADNPDIDAVGFNCMSGPHHLLEYIRRLDLNGVTLSVMPIAGYPTVLGRRMVYQGTPHYFGEKLAEIARTGAAIVGGCCGAAPDHIAAAAALRTAPRPRAAVHPAAAEHPHPLPAANTLAEKLDRGKRVVAVELDPPVDDGVDFFLDGVQAIRNAGADAVTIADCPVGRPRADSSLLACKIKRELGVEPLPHMTCRDRNLNAAKALLLGLSIEGVHNILLVTGDPIPSQDRDEVKSVFNFNSRKLTRYVAALNAETLRVPFRIFGALNVNAKNFAIQLRIAQEKEACGVTGFLTQPVLSQEALDNLRLARETLRGKILGGVYPVVSYKNACFLNNEIAGMRIAPEIVSLYEGKDREAAEELAVTISLRAAKAMEPYTDGLYLMTPFKRVALITRILEELKG